ncbi:MAG: lipid-A-disaccharide synthase N-terminal domain-containing protein [Burkholderiaceae bacterium]
MKHETWWLLLGFFGQALFMMRFVIQWIHSERLRKSVVPLAFWHFSIWGGVTLLIYSIYREDPVFITGQLLGIAIYLRNLHLIKTERLSAEAADSPGPE